MSRHNYPCRTVNGIKKKLHRIVMEQLIGRELTSDEHVYHLDGDPRNNTILNLIIIKKNRGKV